MNILIKKYLKPPHLDNQTFLTTAICHPVLNDDGLCFACHLLEELLRCHLAGLHGTKIHLPENAETEMGVALFWVKYITPLI